ncbi:Protein of unknown function [Geoalkalibacter ferrihydriticus]|uniref:DUF2868 domain-containing protein n=2 Tax=Geoalkalibacter ferrihydriticus TaxID=392333 RepID=A0A0C2HM39_9BACT|nr:DUF2868 domain-containing protein [Geoalkalibacter ferrihydriticus]KIH78126.1 hypothetical protein GFER_06025 [Geoalkalibacter ferrihydriticus DSM 17813]SDM80070.1 Protein of unknown function [Geoalkalibacter ferrihydriticus]
MSKNASPDWTVADLVDLEYLLLQDGETDAATLARRDRALYRAHLSAEEDRRRLLRRWVELRREALRKSGAAPLPGEVVALILRPLRLLLFFLGGLFGAGLAWGVLSYAGDRPINLFAALGLLVGLPFAASLVSVLLPAVRLFRRGTPAGRLGFWLTGALLARVARRAYAFLGGRGASQGRMAMAQGWGVLRGRGGLYVGAMGWLAYGLMQLAAVGFSLGVLAAVFLRGWIADLAFSWQTTARLSAEQVHGFAVALARPWSTFLDPPLSHPTLEQVAGSRVFLKEGLQQLVSTDLQSWWYFLLWAILLYAVVPRLMLLGASWWGARHARRRLSFRDARCEALVRRMQHPQVQLGRENAGEAQQASVCDFPPEEAHTGFAALRVLVPVELRQRPAAERLETEVREEFGAEVQSLAEVDLDEEQDAAILDTLGETDEKVAVLLILEGWQPCIVATLEYLKALRRTLGPGRLLVIGLVGRETPGRWGSSTPEHEFDIWRQRLAALGDPWLLVHNWGGVSHG